MSKDAALAKFQEVAGMAIGEASVCWTGKPQGVFDSDRAILVLRRVIKAAQDLHEELGALEYDEARAVANKVAPLRNSDYSPVLASASIVRAAPKLTALYAIGFEDSGQPVFWASGDLSDIARAQLIFTDISLKFINGQALGERVPT